MSILTNISPSIPSFAEQNLPEMVPGSAIGSEFQKKGANITVAAEREKAALINGADTIDVSNPSELLQFQSRMNNYNHAINFIATLTHKGASAIDSVLKAP
ncbi:type III secretion system inner rod subunit SctI [Yersinia enterocolitica]|uniref:Virulence associated protein n=1 Tax=Yersinia enterocolitica serotype O:8 / biotype 1B (strain NCTC 13174 / 8081) TaxID=393305 RepID=A1JQB4_YERE8|nr:type III secretion system inner rod subunit SctI [Yersinia enterocolitica]AJJ25264.1 putative methyl-accepting chemotaxis protein [Yersinia enterocolitica]CAL13576.1 putative virulence associated protein [Yersinia enterocolitica subsp. enterocolitica 8081]CNF72397.1 putative virulence associated protein [Yersinia enterocolitica]CNK61152.1 putative virulence associated protein [Yersinia enterocolitica]CRY24551.1 putative virulence associated protein [Yersinia enterocolitica]